MAASVFKASVFPLGLQDYNQHEWSFEVLEADTPNYPLPHFLPIPHLSQQLSNSYYDIFSKLSKLQPICKCGEPTIMMKEHNKTHLMKLKLMHTLNQATEISKRGAQQSFY